MAARGQREDRARTARGPRKLGRRERAPDHPHPGGQRRSLLATLSTAQGRGTPGVTAVVGGTQAVVVLICYAVGFVLVAGIVLVRRDVT